MKAVANSNAEMAILICLRTDRPVTCTANPSAVHGSEEIIDFSSAGQLIMIVAPALIGDNLP